MTLPTPKALLPTIKQMSNDIEPQKPLPTSLQSHFIPEDILFSLTQLPKPPDKLGPIKKLERNLETSVAVGRKNPSNAWNFSKQRNKFRHLLEQTPCICGAGKDISFLYDVQENKLPPEKPDSNDPSQIRAQEKEKQSKEMQLPDTLIPEEYHIVKNKGVLGLEYHEDDYTTQTEDHESHLVLFPSMNPTSRFEVIQLKKTLESMLDSINEEVNSLQGPTQMHNLLDLIKKEQNIYNIIFHEIIRQVSVQCAERGQLLSELRLKYSELLNRVPSQISGMHEEVLAQRALDRRLTEELHKFKSTILALTSELSEVKEHDRQVTRQAHQAQIDLKATLLESEKNAALLTEYHDLYELQRKRLEKQVDLLTEEREIWSSAAYNLALKVMDEHSLNISKRMHISEKAWTKFTNHFAILLSDKDTEQLTKLQGHVDCWRDLIDKFNTSIWQIEESMVKKLKAIRSAITDWKSNFEKNIFGEEGNILNVPEGEFLKHLHSDIKKWEENTRKYVYLERCIKIQIVGGESEKFGGDVFVSGQEAMAQIKLQIDGWTDCALKVFHRHQSENGEKYSAHNEMLQLNTLVEELLSQYQIRMSGENGVAAGLIHICNNFETWDNKLMSLQHGSNPLPDQEWSRFYQLLDDWLVHIDDTVQSIGLTQREDHRNEGKSHQVIEISEVIYKSQLWFSSSTNGIDSEDAKLIEQVSSLHTEMVRWMVQILLRIAPDKLTHSVEVQEAAKANTMTTEMLSNSAENLFERLENFSNNIATCCNGIVVQAMQERLERHEEHADQEYQNLQKIKTECDEWIRSAKMMLCGLTGEKYSEMSLTNSVEQNIQSETNDVEKTSKTEVIFDEKTSAEEKEQHELEPTKEIENERLEILGVDENTHTHEIIEQKNGSLEAIDNEESNTEGKKTNDSKGYEALVAIEDLQMRLVQTEERAQEAENRASAAELSLREAMERIRELETDQKETISDKTPTENKEKNQEKQKLSSAELKPKQSKTNKVKKKS